MKYARLIVPFAVLGAGIALAHHDAGRETPAPGQSLPSSPRTGKGTGVIQRIDPEKGVVTIKHGALQGIVAPAMTMSFLVKDKAILANLEAQQRVNFEIAHENGIYVITRITQ